MRSKKIPTVLSFFRRGLKNSDHSSYGWYNMGRAITEEEMERFKKFADNHSQISLCCVISGISPMRPQRTWGDMPEWIRGSDEYYSGQAADGTFIFMWWGDELSDNKEAEIENDEKHQAIKSFESSIRNNFVCSVASSAIDIKAKYSITDKINKKNCNIKAEWVSCDCGDFYTLVSY